MYRFEYPTHLNLLLLLLIVIAVFMWYLRWRKKAINKFGEEAVVEKLFPDYSRTNHILKFIFVAVSLALIISGYANFQFGSDSKKVNHQGIDLAIVLDVSNSMLAKDVTLDRLTFAKQFASRLINRFPDDRISVVTFAGAPFLQLPLTPDHAAVQMLISVASEENAPEEGSDIGAAISEAVKSLPENQNRYKAILILSDGEDHEAAVTDALKTASDQHITICSVAIGTEQGSTIPIINSNNEVSYLRDEKGVTVVTKMNSSILKTLANETKGVFVQANSEMKKSVAKVASRLEAIKINQCDENLFTEYESRFQYFLFAALLLLVIELFLSSKKQNWFSFKPKSKTMKSFLLFITIYYLASAKIATAQTPAELIEKGNQLYYQKDFLSALNYFQTAIKNDKAHQYSLAIFNSANSFYQLKKYDEAIKKYTEYISTPVSNEMNEQTQFNIGNCYLSMGNLAMCVTAYKSALKLNPNDEEARYNLAYAIAKLSGNQKPKQEISNPSPAKKEEKKKPQLENQNMPPEDLKKLLQSLAQSETGTLKNEKQQSVRRKKSGKTW